MTPQKKTILIISGAIVLIGGGIAAYHFFSKKPNTGEEKSDKAKLKELEQKIKDIEKSGGGVGSVSTDEYSATNPIPGSQILKTGNKGRRIAVWQALLNFYKGEKLKIDGEFGQLTRVASIKHGYCNAFTDCEIDINEFVSLLEKTKDDTSFKQLYSPKTNNDLKTVYQKYSS